MYFIHLAYMILMLLMGTRTDREPRISQFHRPFYPNEGLLKLRFVNFDISFFSQALQWCQPLKNSRKKILKCVPTLETQFSPAWWLQQLKMYCQRWGQSSRIYCTGPLPVTMVFSLQPLKAHHVLSTLNHKDSLKTWARVGCIVTTPSILP